ncbi:MAG: sigma-70 family RNA polymerase sigma factor [Anaerolineae bacterium]|jgi:RNA polymerase sigma-70 factor (ECF subfamily)|nr:sigma-70 family RNA polymerase sigma factor [Anaerolineae bacterium]
MTDAVQELIQVERGRVLATLIGILRDVELAEDCLQDAMIAALRRWPTDGVPRSPAAWLTTVARNRALDRLRHDKRIDHSEAGQWQLENARTPETDMLPDDIPDERLKLMFTCCHPSLAREAQVALTLQTLGGLSTTEIAAAFLVPLGTMQQRLVRAKQKIRDARIPYDVPPAHALAERLDAVLAVLYLIFNAGYVTSTGDGLVRHDLCAEAIRLGRVLCDLMRTQTGDAQTTESYGLLALMLLHDSRRAARSTPEGDLILLEDQDRTLWDAVQVREGVLLLDHALSFQRVGAYQIQAAIAALHAQAPSADQTDWAQIALLYEALHKLHPSPVVALNHAVAVAMSDGAERGLLLVEGLEGLDEYYLYHAVRADLLRRLGALNDARAAYASAYAMCPNRAERAYLSKRMAECA